jgi:hypothetical protein
MSVLEKRALLAMFLAAPVGASDEGDDFTNNLISDLAPWVAV